MRMYSFGVYILLAIVAKFVSCRPDGASPGSCITMYPGHFNPISSEPSESQDKPSPYIFTAGWDRRTNTVRVSVSGDFIQGFLIQGRLSKYGPAVGHFINIAENPDAKFQDCSLETQFDANSSVTHSNRNYQDKLDFYWEPPTNNTGNVTFFATLASNKNKFWVFQETKSIPLVPHYLITKTPAPTTDGNGSNTATLAVLLQSLVLMFTTLVLLS